MGCCSTKSTTANNRVLQPKSKGAHCGVKELKLNYRIASDTKVLGAGAFGKVFLSESIADRSFKVAIKVLNKSKLKDNIT